MEGMNKDAGAPQTSRGGQLLPALGQEPSVSFLRLPGDGLHSKNEFSYSSGGWKPKSKVSTGLVSSEASPLLL